MVLLGGVSIFGGSGTLYGVFLSILIILNIRNGMGLAGLSGHFQTGVIGVLLILSVLGPNLFNQARASVNRRRLQADLRNAQPDACATRHVAAQTTGVIDLSSQSDRRRAYAKGAHDARKPKFATLSRVTVRFTFSRRRHA